MIGPKQPFSFFSLNFYLEIYLGNYNFLCVILHRAAADRCSAEMYVNLRNAMSLIKKDGYKNEIACCFFADP